MTINECHWQKNLLGLLLANKEIQEPQKISIQVSLSQTQKSVLVILYLKNRWKVKVLSTQL